MLRISKRGKIGMLISAMLPAAVFFLSAAPEVRIKDIAYIQGVRENQLVGIGIVTGLNGKGDNSRSILLGETLSTMLSSFDIEIDPGEIRSKNCALVTVTADIPPFIRAGDRISVTISSIVDAKNLQGGVLLQTNLKGANGEVYAVAQGVIPVTEKSVNATSAYLPGGALVERDVLSGYVTENRINIVLRYPDFATSYEVAEKINEAIENTSAVAIDASLVQVEIPEETRGNPVRFMSAIENVRVVPSISGRVVINPKSGVVVIGENVRVGKVAVSYKGDSISVGGFSGDQAMEQFTFPEFTSVEDLVDVMQTVGLKTDVIIEVLQAIDRAGALFGELIIM
jgi:flagellar P-ring protein FlgI